MSLGRRRRVPRLLVGASGGGHWVQLMRLSPLFHEFDTAFVSVSAGYSEEVVGGRYHVVTNCSRFTPHRFVPAAIQVLRVVAAERPDVVITTGAAPMLFLILFGRLFGARTLWIDSVANCERLSTSGRIARAIAHQTLSQWEDVAERERVAYWGSVL